MILNFIRQVLGRAILWISHLTRPKPMVRSEEDQAPWIECLDRYARRPHGSVSQ